MGSFRLSQPDGCRSSAGARDKAVAPATTISRILVYGLLAIIVGTMTIALVAIGFMRLLIVYLPFDPPSRNVWAAEAIVGGIFTLAGLLVWTRRRTGAGS